MVGNKLGFEKIKQLPELYHLSFNNALEGILLPRNPHGSELTIGKYPEPDLPRVSFSPTYYQCFLAIYPNISHFFEKNNYPFLIMHVYQGYFKGNERVVGPKTLTNKRMVWDAHVTDEFFSLDPVNVVKRCVIRILNTKNKKDLYTHPFNDKSLEKKYIGPKDIDYEEIESFSMENMVLIPPSVNW